MRISKKLLKQLRLISHGFLAFHEDIESPHRYTILRRNIIILMILVTFVPLISMAAFNYLQYQSNMRREILTPLRLLMSKTVHSFDLLMKERLSMVRSVASSNSFEELSKEETLNRLYRVLKKEFGGFVDLGVINGDGIQVAYAGPYKLLGKDYSKQGWHHEVEVRGFIISNVFMGYREFPHMAIAVQQFADNGETWTLRVTLDTQILDSIITAMELDSESDAFLINDKGIIQTHSKFYGAILDKFDLVSQTGGYGPQMSEELDPTGRGKVLMLHAKLTLADYSLIIVKPQSVVLKSWYTLQSEMFFILIGSSILIVIAVFKIADFLVNQIKKADERRESAFRELEHTQKLSSIGRLAAGVAHEINNPMAIIDQKAGLMKDLIELDSNFKDKEKFLQLTDSIIGSVDRCKTITHRLLGFARRMEINFELLDVNEVIKEVLGFLEKEAVYRKVLLNLHLSPDLPLIPSDKGQLQQVFLNIITNSFAAIEDGGEITIMSWVENSETIGISIKDNGCGMSKETLNHIFEPFFSTKKGSGTGLGLPITYGIIKKLGGEFKVTSQLGHGTSFIVFLKNKPKEAKGEK
ncbi:two-component sensor histidine kinase [bacterium]|nr:two-component sensor histidine kinase [bacterium]